MCQSNLDANIKNCNKMQKQIIFLAEKVKIDEVGIAMYKIWFISYNEWKDKEKHAIVIYGKRFIDQEKNKTFFLTIKFGLMVVIQIREKNRKK